MDLGNLDPVMTEVADAGTAISENKGKSKYNVSYRPGSLGSLVYTKAMRDQGYEDHGLPESVTRKIKKSWFSSPLERTWRDSLLMTFNQHDSTQLMVVRNNTTEGQHQVFLKARV